jgi:hypothetical protein
MSRLVADTLNVQCCSVREAEFKAAAPPAQAAMARACSTAGVCTCAHISGALALAMMMSKMVVNDDRSNTNGDATTVNHTPNT